MNGVDVYLQDGPLRGAVRTAPVGPDGKPAERFEFDHRADGGLFYVEYQRVEQGEDGWHYRATGIEQRADEE